jgi:hypothetical protein
MDKPYLHHLWTRLRPIKTWYLLCIFAVLVVVHVVALRSNYTTMTSLRSAVFAADKNNGGVETALQKLRAYVGAHMNTNLDSDNGVYPPIQLKYTYERLVATERERVNAVNSRIYTEAQQHCERLHPGSFSGGPRVPCIQEYVKDHGATARIIPDAQYKFSFASPRWSPDVAGWSLVCSLLFLALAAIRFALGYWLRRVTR